MKSMAIKCDKCGRVSNPVHLEIVKDTWIKKGYAYAEFDCPQCLKTHVLKTLLPKE